MNNDNMFKQTDQNECNYADAFAYNQTACLFPYPFIHSSTPYLRHLVPREWRKYMKRHWLD